MDRRFTVSIGILFALLVVSYPIFAAATDLVVVEKDDQNRPTIILEEGKGKEAGLVKVTHIHYAKSEGKEPKATVITPCYKVSGWKWAKPVKYTINAYSQLPTTTIMNAITNADTTWDAKSSKILFSPPVTGVAAAGTYDGKNAISFGNYPTSGVIAITTTWYWTTTKEAVESDILFDTDFTWGDATKTAGVMDLQNIATHEIGHSLGLGDLYTSSCSAVTMYGYSSYGDTKKRTIETPDINGLQKIYGV
jgi:predicted Zn-dependent protease